MIPLLLFFTSFLSYIPFPNFSLHFHFLLPFLHLLKQKIYRLPPYPHMELTVYSTSVSAIRRTADVVRTTSAILDSLSVPYAVVDVSSIPTKRKWMTEVSGTRIIPQIFAGDRFLMVSPLHHTSPSHFSLLLSSALFCSLLLSSALF
jgi:glutaredoxin